MGAMKASLSILSVCCVVLLLAPAVWSSQCEPNVGTNVLPAVTQVPGKSYSDQADKNAAGVPTPLQNIWFSGNGTAQDAINYSGNGVQFLPAYEVDAMANSQDAYFWDVANDKVPMLVSRDVQGDIEYQMGGADITGLWTTPPQINSTSMPLDVDALEVWGASCAAEPPAQTHDTNMFSLVGDPNGWAVYRYNPVTQMSTGFVASAQIDNAIAMGATPDLDALMVWDSQDNGVWDPGDAMMFSIRPGGPYDGGEIWLWRYGQFASFITHGGERWDTNHPVGLHFGYGPENVNALEGVPEPTTLLFLATGAAALLRRKR
jgi:hypothetical protein